ncbi:hypothetical protein C1Y16_31770 [Pseudomonas sp. MPR-ANB1]|nr:hypothetical protein C1Y16_31770 [Pseudomonas sp. MPR-ANB1]
MWEAPLNLQLGAVAQQTGTPVASRLIVASGLVVASRLIVASGLVVASRLVVASGLAPRWAAKQPQ